MKPKRKQRIIEKIRKLFPNLTWYYDFPVWKNTEGWEIVAFARYSPQYEGDDDTFITEYRRSDTNEVIYELSPLPLK